ncbi:MAG TPA: HNH endonuclease [Firmicutes bacterium]|nr:HNH endonuclease [Candidatus Fermentithermobacillaceae bacterium]
MGFTPSIAIGAIVSNERLRQEFQCSNQGGMRFSRRTNTLLLISDPTKSPYVNEWKGNILHYTGMGLNGDQSLEHSQNRTLALSKTNGVEVHLAERYKTNQYIYLGRVVLDAEPYQSQQEGKDGRLRRVWVFPLKVTGEALAARFRVHELHALELDTFDLFLEAKQRGNESPRLRAVEYNTYDRNPYVSAAAKRRANGKCQLCGKSAPFLDPHGQPYLETHHIIWLSRGGPDTLDNTVALCPNCHRKMHILDLESDREKLRKAATQGAAVQSDVS